MKKPTIDYVYALFVEHTERMTKAGYNKQWREQEKNRFQAAMRDCGLYEHIDWTEGE